MSSKKSAPPKDPPRSFIKDMNDLYESNERHNIHNSREILSRIYSMFEGHGHHELETDYSEYMYGTPFSESDNIWVISHVCEILLGAIKGHENDSIYTKAFALILYNFYHDYQKPEKTEFLGDKSKKYEEVVFKNSSASVSNVFDLLIKQLRFFKKTPETHSRLICGAIQQMTRNPANLRIYLSDENSCKVLIDQLDYGLSNNYSEDNIKILIETLAQIMFTFNNGSLNYETAWVRFNTTKNAVDIINQVFKKFPDITDGYPRNENIIRLQDYCAQKAANRTKAANKALLAAVDKIKSANRTKAAPSSTGSKAANRAAALAAAREELRIGNRSVAIAAPPPIDSFIKDMNDLSRAPKNNAKSKYDILSKINSSLNKLRGSAYRRYMYGKPFDDERNKSILEDAYNTLLRSMPDGVPEIDYIILFTNIIVNIYLDHKDEKEKEFGNGKAYGVGVLYNKKDYTNNVNKYLADMLKTFWKTSNYDVCRAICNAIKVMTRRHRSDFDYSVFIDLLKYGLSNNYSEDDMRLLIETLAEMLFNRFNDKVSSNASAVFSGMRGDEKVDILNKVFIRFPSMAVGYSNIKPLQDFITIKAAKGTKSANEDNELGGGRRRTRRRSRRSTKNKRQSCKRRFK